MFADIFYWLLNMSISSVITGLVVLLLGRLRKIPRRFVYILWFIPFIRMWLPFGMTSKYSLMTLISKLTTRTVVVYKGVKGLTTTNYVMAADSYFPITYKVNLLENIFQIAFIIWAIVAAALLLALIIIYTITRSELKSARHLSGNIYISDKITSPATYGIFKPMIILPEKYEQKDLQYILLHENIHIKAGDNLWRIIAFVSVIIHWFNPLAWLFLKIFLEEAELACDEWVMASCGEAEKKAYATVLVNCCESKNVFASAFGGAKVRVRVNRILSYRKLSLFSVISFAVLVSAIGYTLITNAV